MRHFTVRGVMTADPATVTPATSLKDVAEILVKQKVSSVPVLDLRGKVIGLVAETGLIRKEELQRDPDVPRSRHMTFRARRDLATAETAGEIMTAHPVTVLPGTGLADAARLMDRHHVTCLPVVDDDGKILGAVSSRDLLRVFLRPDHEIKSDIIDEVLVGFFGTNTAMVHVEVADGVVRLSGELERKSMLPLVLPMIRAVDGVIDAEGELRYALTTPGCPLQPT
jgi:CBS domain-containing protein